jgi:hypothetical protein
VHRLKIAVLLAATVGAIAVSAAPAMALKAFNAKEQGQVKGHQTTTQVFTTKFGTVECGEVNSSGDVAKGSASQVKQRFEFNKCKAFGFVSATISPAQLKFFFTGSEGANKGSVVSEQPITIKASTCTVTVPGNQEFKEAITYANVGNDIEGTADATGIHYEGKGLGCSGSGTNGEYKGSQLIEGNIPPEVIKVE